MVLSEFWTLICDLTSRNMKQWAIGCWMIGTSVVLQLILKLARSERDLQSLRIQLELHDKSSEAKFASKLAGINISSFLIHINVFWKSLTGHKCGMIRLVTSWGRFTKSAHANWFQLNEALRVKALDALLISYFANLFFAQTGRLHSKICLRKFFLRVFTALTGFGQLVEMKFEVVPRWRLYLSNSMNLTSAEWECAWWWSFNVLPTRPCTRLVVQPVE